MSYAVGTSGVENYANTRPGLASGVVADAYNGYGDSVGDGGVSVQGNGGPTAYYVLMENSGFVLQEDGSKIQLES